MLVKHGKWLVLEDGTCMNLDNGGILWASKDRSGRKCFKLLDDKGKTHFYLQQDLLNERRELEKIHKAVAAQMDYEEYGDAVLSSVIEGVPQIVEDFEDSVEISAEEANKRLKDSIVRGKSKEVKMKHKQERDNAYTILDLIKELDD